MIDKDDLELLCSLKCCGMYCDCGDCPGCPKDNSWIEINRDTKTESIK